MVFDPNIRAGIFAGESGGDYNALFGYQNRPNGQFSNVQVTQMPVGDVIAFTDPSGPYAQYVRGQVGHVATPVGAYQVVGSTLRDAVNALGIDPSTRFDQQTQDRIGQWILENQGTGAWEGYQAGATPSQQPYTQVSTRGMDTQMPQPQQPRGLLEYFGVQEQGSGPQGDLPFYQRDRFRDMAGRVAVAANSLRQNPDQNIPAMAEMRRQERATNRTAEWLSQQPNSAEFVQMLQSGADPTQVLMAYRQSQQPVQADPTSGMQNYQFMLSQGLDPQTAMERAFGAGGTTVNVGGDQSSVGWEAIDKAYADTWLRDSTSGLADVASQAAQISSVLEQLEAGEELTGPAIGVQGDFLRALTNPEAQDAKDRVEQVVQRSLRETLGAQFTQAEGDRLIARAYNINLSPQQNAARLRALLTQLQSVALQKQSMREHFNEFGTLRGFSGNMNIPTIDDLIASMDAVAPMGQPTEPTSGGGGLSPDDLKYLGIE